MNFTALEKTEDYKDQKFEGKYILAPSLELTKSILVDLSKWKACASMTLLQWLKWQYFSLIE